MPKKYKGENSKAAEARSRKEQKKVDEQEQKQKALEDEYWRDDDKHVVRKQQRKDDREKKRIEQLEKKKQNEQLLAEEMSSMKSAKPIPTKVTRAQAETHREEIAAAEATAATKKSETDVTDLPLEENVNRLCMDEAARSVDDAIVMLSNDTAAVEKHPERRVKAAYAAYEEKNLPILKAENPNFRLSQLKQILKKDWMKSPENPMNQRIAAYNAKK